MHPARRTCRPTTRGFSLIEMLTVIAIIGIILAITFPAIKAIQGDSKISAAQNTIGMSVDVARQWVKPRAWAPDAGTPIPTTQSYSGTAALVCPTNEVRIVLNSRVAQDGSVYLENENQNGYYDLDGVDYISIPNGGAVVGIQRTGSGASDVRFLAPPFAIAFNENGQLNYGDASGRIYYDSNSNGSYTRASTRAAVSGGYDPADWNGSSAATNANVISGIRPVKALPFEAIECVSGVIVYDAKAFADAGNNFSGGGTATINGTAGAWLKENGRAMFFSPLTGSALYDEGQ